MPYSVSRSFEVFRHDTVDLDPTDTSTARKSRDHLFANLKNLNTQDRECPNIYSHSPFGSFARRTKIRPLDDIDLLALILGMGISPVPSPSDQYVYRLRIDDKYYPLVKFDNGSGYVSSTRLLNQIKKSLANIANYSKADVKRNQVAVVLDLTSYSWVFDIVPAIPVFNYDKSKTLHYLIPNGSGDWVRTNPHKDIENTIRVNRLNDGLFLPVTRLLKYWNSRNHKPVLSSYYFETLCLMVFDGPSKTISSITSGIARFFNLAPIHLSYSCYDPKGLGPPLDNNVSSETKNSVKTAMNDAYANATAAGRAEESGKTEDAINAWKKVFGSSFPSYG